jgi:hypothetical protein
VDDLATWLDAQLAHDATNPVHSVECVVRQQAPGPSPAIHCQGCEGARRTRREVESKLRILDVCVHAADTDDMGAAKIADQVRRLLALPYASWPGFRAEWLP